ncbi:ABC transporter substrate-binding protein [Amycolatopsis panacis]|uniref:Solute-binding protein family 5 domain-containing protein n=1 Tax=Amycolatopsis panacis TaxID=2340917 RepID=A0A419I2I8_9PSEU|nr:ABC transporter substrate-binding protein [Amycolatopsis panacis]RJQ84175.1 hypothetical protein D5S19_17735 [Amycolatopsis panacis]
MKLHEELMRRLLPRPKADRRRSRSFALVLAVVSTMVTIAACGTGGAGGGDRETLTIAIGAEALPNPALATTKSAWSAVSYNLVYEPLIRQLPNGSLRPALAAAWEYVDGAVPNTVFQMTLRDGAKFADGSAVTPQAVAKWLQYFVRQTGPLAGVLGANPTFQVVGSNKVQIRMTSPNPSLPVILSDGGGNIGHVVSPAGIDNPDSLATDAHGAGPYVLDSAGSVRGDHYSYKPNPNYFDQNAIKFRKVEVKVIQDASARLAAQQSGQVDVAIGDSSTAEPAQQAGLGVITAPRGVIEIVLDSKNGLAPELADKRVREAINHAIDRKSIAQALLGKAGIPASAFLPTDVTTGMDAFWTYDPAKAKSLLVDAGYPNGFEMKALVQGPYFGPLGEPLMRAVAQNLAAVGIKLNITSYATDPEYAKDVFGKKAPVFTLTGLIADTPTLYNTYMAPKARVNFFGDDEVLTREFDAGARSQDPTAHWTTMWRLFTSQAYVAPVLVNPNFFYVSEHIAGAEATAKRPVALPTEWSRK